MRALQDRMNDMRQYFRGIDVYNDALMVKVALPRNWRYYSSADDRIKVAPSEDGSDIVFFYADSNNTSYDEIFDFVEQTIKENEEITLKLTLLKEKVEELKDIFSNTPYEKLKTLSFIFEDKKEEKPKRKYTKKKKVEKTDNNEEKQENVEDATANG